jgi:hypothetical protein
VLMWFAVHVLVLEILGLQILDSARFIYRLKTAVYNSYILFKSDTVDILFLRYLLTSPLKQQNLSASFL